MAEQTNQTIWREGDRIRTTDGTGYSDRVTDDTIREHLADASKGVSWTGHAQFAQAVLAIRAFERVTAKAAAS